jgi:hypothetical protein
VYLFLFVLSLLQGLLPPSGNSIAVNNNNNNNNNKGKKEVEPGKLYMTIIQRMLLACWIAKATDTHPQYAIGVLIAFPGQQWLHERFSLR